MQQVLLDVDELIKLVLIKLSANSFKSVLIFDMFSGELPAEKVAPTKALLRFLLLLLIISSTLLWPKALKGPHAEVLSLVVPPVAIFGEAKLAKALVVLGTSTQPTGKGKLPLQTAVLGEEKGVGAVAFSSSSFSSPRSPGSLAVLELLPPVVDLMDVRHQIAQD
ncbi:hypothetical protein TYRP_015081 [Tyrophagus putrescentiae]|nr:hypothetical protein TYRP_015081 [Tyrophagus putrescentiae]